MSITLNLINRKKLSQAGNLRKYAVQHRNKWYPLNNSEKLKIKVAIFVGTLFFVGGLAEHIAKNYYCNKLKTQLRAEERERQAALFKNKAIRLREGTEELAQNEASHYQLARVPAHKERVANPVDPFSIRSQKYQYLYRTKEMDESLPPTVKAALWRRSHLYL